MSSVTEQHVEIILLIPTGNNVISSMFPACAQWPAVNIPAHVRAEVFLMSGLGKNRENVAILITALVISRVHVYYPEACCKTT